ncbi:hypothetical protein [Vibrio sp. SCSIO 43155]|uniref:hypothetical protein n=1 Tax=Vibrio sp. SCSIO 43155 TaxID=2819099 RepID=UPI002074C042|nr:hypothetical protein [Vibrio sp. SCSIO 43155]USD58462.1 hypothetical protein J4N44_27600 [Vibrio sp. SCSIO 43155]
MLTKQQRRFLPDIMFIVCFLGVTLLVWSRPNQIIPQLDTWNYTTIDALPVGKTSFLLFVLTVYAFIMNFRAQKLNFSGFKKFASKESTTITLAVLLAFSMLATLTITSYKLRLVDSIITAQNLQVEYRQQKGIRPRMDSPIHYEEVASDEALSRLNTLMETRTGLALDFNDWDESHRIIGSYLESVSK